MHPRILPPSPSRLLPPFLASLPAAAVSTQPPTALLPLLSPILRQRVQLLSTSANEPWLPLLCYDNARAGKLLQIVKSERFEPHPVSGEVEVDWDGEVETRYKRIDEDTLQALILVRELELSVRLVWCVGDQEGGGDGWRIGEVGVLESTPASEEVKWGWETIDGAEARSKDVEANGGMSRTLSATNHSKGLNVVLEHERIFREEEDDDDDAYWAQYDSTPARTPAIKRSPVPGTEYSSSTAQADDDTYYAQYAQVQPAMDNHDPDEAEQNGDMETTLGHDEITHNFRPDFASHPDFSESAQAWSKDPLLSEPPPYDDDDDVLIQPRPASSGSSRGESTVARLERTAAAQGQSEIGVKQRIGTTIKSLYRLAKAAGVDRAEFERLVRTELDCLGLMDEDDD